MMVPLWVLNTIRHLMRIWGTQKGTMVLTTSHMGRLSTNFLLMASCEARSTADPSRYLDEHMQSRPKAARSPLAEIKVLFGAGAPHVVSVLLLRLILKLNTLY